MQGNGAEMLRLAAWRLCEAGIVPNMLVHDAMLFELDNEEQMAHAVEIMKSAGRMFVMALKSAWISRDTRWHPLRRQTHSRQRDVGLQ